MIQRRWTRGQLMAAQTGKWCGEGPCDDGANRGSRVSTMHADRSQWMARLFVYRRLCVCYGSAPGNPSAEGDQALQVLGDSAQGELTLQWREAWARPRPAIPPSPCPQGAGCAAR